MALDKTITDQYLLWCEHAVADPDVVDELKEMASYVTSDIDYDGIYNALIHFNIL